MTAAPLLSVRDLSVRFGDFLAVDGVGFDVAPGEVVCIVGESGSGKSVTGRAIMGLLDGSVRRGGEILLRGEALQEASEKRMNAVRGKEISMIFQEPMTALNPGMRVGAQIAEVLLLHFPVTRAEAMRRAVALLERVGIRDAKTRARAFPHELSGGMRQRVMIAIACAADPALIIADEPTTALDVTVQAQVLELLFEMQRELGSAVVFVTHDLGVVAGIADRVVVLYRGKVVEEGTVTEIFTRARHPYTRALIAAAPDVELPRTPGLRFPTVDTDAIFGRPGSAPAPQAPAPVPAAPASLAGSEDDAAVPALELRNLRRTFRLSGGILPFGGKVLHAVDGVSLTIAPGTTTALIGESGSGKSTLGRCVARLDRPTSGDILYRGRDVVSLRGDELMAFRRQVQTIFQDPFASLNPRRTVGDAVTDGLAIHGLAGREERHERARALLARVGLDPDYVSRYPHQFSGGQRQRIAIARALALDPRFIVADEAVSALDVSVRAQVLNLLSDLQDEHRLSFLFITHDLSTVRQFADRVAIMQAGEIVEEGETEAIFTDPQHAYTRALLAAVPRIHLESARRLRPLPA
ncbi:ABC transporter ATP-binding protein [Stappia indica]|uniref:Dipeptide ABC transporter ATP-binding protein n=1 Tax=Stappia indica TaxID=538381 RepID=A0A857C9B4_9HYPH|nr:ABC transporter ATP-binding protein [Stappia indica]QGZ35563.1 dipeptide ABC transporter ATP-binding protein [Stappia indica]